MTTPDRPRPARLDRPATSRGIDLDAEVRRLAAEQAGVFTRRQARDLGLSARVVATRLRQRRWLAYRGVLRLADRPDGDAARLWAAVLRGGPATVVSGCSSLWVQGIDVPAAMPTIIIPANRHVAVPGAIVLREPAPTPLVSIGRLTCTSPSAAVLDALRTLPYDAALTLADRAAQQRLVTPEHLAVWLAANPGRRGARQVRLLLDDLAPGARSRAERRLLALLRRAGIRGWVANHPVVDAAGQVLAVVDVAFPEVRVAVEVDGRAWHTGRTRFQQDRTRQNRLVLAGWTVVRVTWDDVTHRPDEVVRIIREAVRLAAARMSG